MKLIIEIQEWPYYEEGGIKGTMSLPGLSKDGQLTISSVLKNTDITLRHWVDYTPGHIGMSDTALRLGRLERHIKQAVEEFYKSEGLTEVGSCLYPAILKEQ